MPFSNVAMSVSSLWVLGAWILDMIFLRQKGEKRVLNFWLLSSWFLIHIVGLIYTSDWGYAMHDLNAKLPLILFSVVLFTMSPIPRQWLKWVFLSHLVCVLLAGLLSLCFTWQIQQIQGHDARDLSIFISHVRFGLMLAFSAAIAFVLWTNKWASFWVSALLFFAIAMVAVLMQNLTALALFIVLAAVFLFNWFKERGYKKSMFLAILAMVLLPFGLLYSTASYHYGWGGEPLNCEGTQCDESAYYYEGGHRVFCNMNQSELAEAWQKTQQQNLYTDVNERGGNLMSTLLRYMSSKGLCKNQDGLEKLSKDDILAIQKGVTNPTYYGKLHERLDHFYFEFDALKSGANPSGKSWIQRLEYLRAGWGIVAKHHWVGVGTGDVKESFKQEYQQNGTQLADAYRLRAHNQYLTYWIAFGVFGFLLLLFTLLRFLTQGFTKKDVLLFSVVLICALSFLTEDTLETQAGVTFVAFWLSLLFVRSE